MLGTKEARTVKSEKTGMNTGTKVALGVGAAAAVAGGVAALAISSGGDSDEETAESTGDLSSWWHFTGSCVGQGCREDRECGETPLPSDLCCGIDFGVVFEFCPLFKKTV
ncbi:hypothetical protein U27_02569 [Candidatus Vecturithrix granuli]|uniref:Uncharacterized protein n=1 Tax=Vecturithrix granuli TaxID=1499967 RepID=A0A081CAY5_VECG1|nr:hypothetical protein U27_02569 [Candidatus Vecturithrix granuli]